MVRDVDMIKVIFIKTNFTFNKNEKDFKLALSWIIIGNLFEKKTTFRRNGRCILPYMLTYESNHVHITNLLVPDNLYL